MKSTQIIEKIAYLKTSTVVIIMVCLGFFYYKNAYDSGASSEAQIVDLGNRLAAATEQKTKTEKAQKDAEEARKSVKSLAEDFDKISKRLPSNLASVDMNKAINNFVSQSGLKQISIRPGGEVKKGIYDEFPFSVQLEGTFSQMAMFIYSVAKAERIASVKEFSIVRTQPLGDGPLKVDAVVINYKLAEPEKPGEVQ